MSIFAIINLLSVLRGFRGRVRFFFLETTRSRLKMDIKFQTTFELTAVFIDVWDGGGLPVLPASAPADDCHRQDGIVFISARLHPHSRRDTSPHKQSTNCARLNVIRQAQQQRIAETGCLKPRRRSTGKTPCSDAEAAPYGAASV